METTSRRFSLSKAKTAFHSAAAKAEKVLTDIKTSSSSSSFSSPINNNNNKPETEDLLHSPSESLGRTHDWQERLRNIRRSKKQEEEEEKNFNLISDFLDFDLHTVSQLKGSEREFFPGIEEDLNASNMDTIPSTTIIKQLATAIQSAKKSNSMKDLLASSRSSSPVRERAGLSFSAMKSLVLREKEDKSTSDFRDDDELLLLSQSLFDPEGPFPRRKNVSGSVMTSLPREIGGAPPDSFVVRLSEIIGSLKTLRKMALFWCRVVTELRRLWSDGQPVPHVPLDESPDLNTCLLHQQLQVINCCISRKTRRSMASDSLQSIMREAGPCTEAAVVSPGSSSALYARVSTGDLVLRLGAHQPSGNLTMLETGEPVYTPVTQEGPILTEDLIKEAEEFVLRTGSCGAGCSQLLSDMQAFKAANPGCILEDFVRWHSPPDWSRSDPKDEAQDSCNLQDSTSNIGQLSSRMQKEGGPGYGIALGKGGNLWRELWETAKPLAAADQTPLFDEDMAVEGVMNFLEEITPFELFQQCFVSLLGSGFVIAEGMLSPNSDLSKLFYECKDYIIGACHGGSWSDNIDDLCQVYETIETIVVYPEDCLKIINQSEETTAIEEPKRRFKKLSLNFGVKDRQFLRKPAIFSRKPPKPTSTASAQLFGIAKANQLWSLPGSEEVMN
ncbi:hypothetical protein IFM89_035258 [Coptis chinensis]|uniref:Rab3GAP catalytic subunit conserved domain-containing protein n=1 Tax=Coptis chinensis TaxID=261450 RepID=A0A835LCI2_9MAGN|nr:hypothetical protein IFM89_035258 [Coptis chinensis]